MNDLLHVAMHGIGRVGQVSESGVDKRTDLLGGFKPGSGGDGSEESCWWVALHQGVEGGDPHGIMFAWVVEDGLQQGEDLSSTYFFQLIYYSSPL